MAAKIVCRKCKEPKSTLDFIRSNAFWFDDGHADICISCLNKMFDPRDLEQVDKMMQYLDIPFYPNDWIDLFEDNGEKRTLDVYCTKFMPRPSNKNVNWKDVNTVWKQKQEAGTLHKTINIMTEDWVATMRVKWGDYTQDEYEILENFFDDISRTQNITSSIQRDQAQNICRLSLVIRQKIQQGGDASKEIKSYNDLVKSAEFTPKNTRNYSDFESIGELINFLVRKGYRPKFYDGSDKDMVDMTIKNTQAYLRRLVSNEPNLSELVEQRRISARIANQLEEEGMDEDEMEKYDNQGFKIDYEDADEELIDDDE